MISGNLTYKDIEYFFILENDEELSLIPKDGFKEKSNALFFKPLDNGIPGALVPIHPIVETDYLIGISSETNEKIIMIPKSYQIGHYNFVLKIIIKTVIKLNKKSSEISKLNFYSDELNYLYNTKKTIESVSKDIDKEIELKLKSFEAVNFETEVFNIDGRNVKCNFDIDKIFTGKDLENPLKIKTRMSFEFEATDDYMFVIKLYYVAKKSIQLLTYRQNINFKEIYTCFLNNDSLYEKNGVIIVNDKTEIEDKVIISKRFMAIDYLKDYIHKIFQEIASATLYTRHIPLSYEDSNIITESSFVLTTAGFEWEFSQLFPEGKEKTQARIDAENIVISELNQIEQNYIGKNGRVREICKNLNKFVDMKGLDSNIKYTFEQLDSIVRIFSNQLYRLKGEEAIYSDIGERLAKQRNDFAHGNLNKEFVDLAFLDVVFLQRVIYIMQLKRIGVDDINIKKCINDLFQCNLLIE